MVRAGRRDADGAPALRQRHLESGPDWIHPKMPSVITAPTVVASSRISLTLGRIQFQNSSTGPCVVTSHSTVTAHLQQTCSGIKRSELAVRRAYSTLRREPEHRLHLRCLPRPPVRGRRQARHAMQRGRLAAHRGVRAHDLLLCALTPKIRRVGRYGGRLPAHRARTTVGDRAAGRRWSAWRGVAVGEAIAD